jgi:hypothetical protein
MEEATSDMHPVTVGVTARIMSFADDIAGFI